MSLINVDVSTTIASWRDKTNQLGILQGDLTSLTDSATSLVVAVNKVHSDVDSDVLSLRTNFYGDSGGVLSLASLTTTNKTSLVSSVNELNRRLPNVYNAAGTLLNT